MQRCEDALRVLSAAAKKYPARDVNLSVKVTALTPLIRPEDATKMLPSTTTPLAKNWLWPTAMRAKGLLLKN